MPKITTYSSGDRVYRIGDNREISETKTNDRTVAARMVRKWYTRGRSRGGGASTAALRACDVIAGNIRHAREAAKRTAAERTTDDRTVADENRREKSIHIGGI